MSLPYGLIKEIGLTMESNPQQGYETMVVNGLIDPAKNGGIAVADKDYDPATSLGQDPKEK